MQYLTDVACSHPIPLLNAFSIYNINQHLFGNKKVIIFNKWRYVQQQHSLYLSTLKNIFSTKVAFKDIILEN